MMQKDIELINSLKPNQKNNVMDLVERAGVDVSKWGIKQDGSIVKKPAENPNYCFEWAFGGIHEPTLLFIWHCELKVKNGRILYEGNFRQLGLELVRKAENGDQTTRSRANSQAKRARNFDRALISCFQSQQPFNVALLAGDHQPYEELGFHSSTVKYRVLDSEQWYVHDYEMATGAFLLVRAVPAQAAIPSATDTQSDKFLDQFSLPEASTKRASIVSTYFRNTEVRKAVLRRASGICELCCAPGFKTHDGSIFLETHHVIPLAEDGPDVEWNVVAICPNDHRQAHYADNRDDIRTQLIFILTKHYPEQAVHLAKLSNETLTKMQGI